MKLSQIQKLVNFCNELIIKRNDDTRGLCSYFEYRGKQYYASLLWDVHNGCDFAVFPALDESVEKWEVIYRNKEIDLVTNKEFREAVFNFLITL